MTLYKKWSFPIKDFFSKCDQIHSFLRICSHLLKKSLIENFICCAVRSTSKQIITSQKKKTNFYQNISIFYEHQYSMDYLKYTNNLKNPHQLDQ